MKALGPNRRPNRVGRLLAALLVSATTLALAQDTEVPLEKELGLQMASLPGPGALKVPETSEGGFLYLRALSTVAQKKKLTVLEKQLKDEAFLRIALKPVEGGVACAPPAQLRNALILYPVASQWGEPFDRKGPEAGAGRYSASAESLVRNFVELKGDPIERFRAYRDSYLYLKKMGLPGDAAVILAEDLADREDPKKAWSQYKVALEEGLGKAADKTALRNLVRDMNSRAGIGGKLPDASLDRLDEKKYAAHRKPFAPPPPPLPPKEEKKDEKKKDDKADQADKGDKGAPKGGPLVKDGPPRPDGAPIDKQPAAEPVPEPTGRSFSAGEIALGLGLTALAAAAIGRWATKKRRAPTATCGDATVAYADPEQTELVEPGTRRPPVPVADPRRETERDTQERRADPDRTEVDRPEIRVPENIFEMDPDEFEALFDLKKPPAPVVAERPEPWPGFDEADLDRVLEERDAELREKEKKDPPSSGGAGK